MTWTAATFNDMPDYTIPVSIPGSANYQSVSTISDFISAWNNTSIDAIQYTGPYSNSFVTLDLNAKIQSGQTRYITSTKDLPPMDIKNGADNKTLIFTNNHISVNQAPSAGMRFRLIDAQNVIFNRLNAAFHGFELISCANTRNKITKNIRVQNSIWEGTQTSLGEYVGFIYRSRQSAINASDFNQNGQWKGEFEDIVLANVHAKNLSDFVQLQGEYETSNQHYSDYDYKRFYMQGCWVEAPAQLSEDGFDFKATSKTWANRAIIEQCIFTGFRAVDGGNVKSNGAAGGGHILDCKYEIRNSIIHDCNRGVGASSWGGRTDIIDCRFSDIPDRAFIANQEPGVTREINIRGCLFDNINRMFFNQGDITLTDNVFRNVGGAGTTFGLSGGGNISDTSLFPGISGTANATFTNEPDLVLPGDDVAQFSGFPTDHAWHPNNTPAPVVLDFTVPMDGQQHDFDTNREINHIGTRNIGGGGSNNLPTDSYGHYKFIGSLSADDKKAGIEADLSAMHSGSQKWNGSTKKGYRGALIRVWWKHFETSENNYNGAYVNYLDTLFDECDANGTYLMPNVLDIRFGLSASNADPTKAHIPGYLEDNGHACVSGNVSNIGACAKLWNTYPADRYIALLKFFFDRYSSHPSFLGVMMPETARSEHTGGSYSTASNYKNRADLFFPSYKRIVDEVNAYYMAGNKNAYLNMHVNFMTGTQDYVPDLFAHAATKVGVEIGTPDFNRTWYPLIPGQTGKQVLAYTEMYNYKDTLVIAPSVETRDQENTPNNTYKMAFEEGNISIEPNRIYWFRWHPSNHPTYQGLVDQLLENKGWHINRNVPTQDQGGGGTIVGKNPTYVDSTFAGDLLKLTARSNASESVTDDFTVEFKDNLGNDENVIARFQDTNIPIGTQTNYSPIYKDLTTADVLGAAEPGWIEDTQYAGYNGAFALKSVGVNANFANGTNEHGQYINIDLTSIQSLDQYIYLRVRARDGSSNSFFAKVGAEIVPDGGHQTISPIEAYQWIAIKTLDQTAFRRFTDTDNTIRIYVRERNLLVDGYVVIDAREPNAPTGLQGYVGELWPGTSNISGPDDISLVRTQDIDLTFTVTLTAGVNSSVNDLVVVDQNNTVVPFTTNVQTIAGPPQVFYVTATVTAQAVGNYTIVCTATVGEISIEERVALDVTELSQNQWPTGVGATIPIQQNVTVGSTFTITPNVQNPANFVLKDDRWDVTGTAVTQNTATNDSGVFYAGSVGQVTVTYTLERADNPADPLIYTMVVNSTAAVVIGDDTYTIANSSSPTELDVLVNDAQTRITTFTQPSQGSVAFNSDNTKLVYTPQTGYIGETSFTYNADQGENVNAATATVTINSVDADSFDGSVKVGIGLTRTGKAGTSFEFQMKVIENPNNYNIAPTWIDNFPIEILTSFPNGKGGEIFILETSRVIENLEDVTGSVRLEINEG